MNVWCKVVGWFDDKLFNDAEVQKKMDKLKTTTIGECVGCGINKEINYSLLCRGCWDKLTKP